MIMICYVAATPGKGSLKQAEFVWLMVPGLVYEECPSTPPSPLATTVG